MGKSGLSSDAAPLSQCVRFGLLVKLVVNAYRHTHSHLLCL
jgi:hypothetical protein